MVEELSTEQSEQKGKEDSAIQFLIASVKKFKRVDSEIIEELIANNNSLKIENIKTEIESFLGTQDEIISKNARYFLKA